MSKQDDLKTQGIGRWLAHLSAGRVAILAAIPLLILGTVLWSYFPKSETALTEFAVTWVGVSYVMIITIVVLFIIVVQSVKTTHKI